MPKAAEDPLVFAQRLLSLIDEGRRTATYKLALLLALIDACVLSSDETGAAPTELSTRAVARRVVELYWPQVRPHGAAPDGLLRQSSQPRAVTVEAVTQLRRLSAAPTLDLTELTMPDAVWQCLDTVELNLIQMPLGKLQRPLTYDRVNNSDYRRFLYDDRPFAENVTSRGLTIRFAPGAPDALVSLAGLLRPLIEVHWTRHVAQLNRIELADDGLHEFLFGSERVALDRTRPGLLDLHDGRCFYCHRPVSRRDIQVDHFVPWSRMPNDAFANLVLSDSRCNNSKRDYFADLALVKQWVERPRQALEDAAREARWPLRYDASVRSARALYGHLPDGSPLWTAPGVFQLLDRQLLSEALPTVAP